MGEVVSISSAVKRPVQFKALVFSVRGMPEHLSETVQMPVGWSRPSSSGAADNRE
jgi:hypothetical protein